MRISQALLFASTLILGWNGLKALDTKLMKLCVSQNTCDSCLEISSSCAWCSDWSYSNSTVGKPRCNLPESLKAFHCDPAEIRTASKGSMELLENNEFQDVKEPDQAPIQLRPQKVRVRLEPRSKTVINLRYKPAKNYPLDLYYLMDLTLTMQNDKQTLENLGWNMTNTLRMFTNNSRLAFGSYADKPLMPILFPGQENNPCKSEHKNCAPLYAFQHRLSLTDDIQRFIKEVHESPITGNVDNLEAGMDGVVQAIVCAERVGWAHQARKIILMATNGLLHFAGDGKLTGTVDRSDFKCHLNKDGMYTMSTTFDYPSLAEVSRLLKDNKVNVIFAVTEERRQEYEFIADLLEEKARVATLANDSSNILQIIKSSYHDLITKVVLRDNSTGPLRMQYFSNCSKENEIETEECGGIEEGKLYDFKVVLSFDQCPRNESLLKQRVVIEDALASKASEVVIDVELLCGCRCKDSDNSRCVHGFDECGVCKCDFGWSGEYCDCDQSSPKDYKQQCTAPGGTKMCSNKGDCTCGSCSCDDGYLGRFCECIPCKMLDGIECGNRGTCECGICRCLPDWKGDACECSTVIELCMAPGSEDVCSGHGDCECGECQCKIDNNIHYRGKYCESSVSSDSSRKSQICTLYNGCVNASIEDPQRIDYNCRTNVADYSTLVVDFIDKNHDSYCCVETNKGSMKCEIPYIYEFQKDNSVLLKIGKKTCIDRTLAAMMKSSGIVAAVVVLGLVFIIFWRIYINIKDKREYEKFELEQSKTVYSLNENPLYRSAVSKYKVPSLYYKED
ncbi:integrin beta-nu [Lasioglossum baleicum]|uniref:integrin beta-nu n=1 Tax=Lasioglossum baleicum TaxID=434251 RepID=UPI003FCDDA33